MTWRCISDKPLSEPVVIQFTDEFASPGPNALSSGGAYDHVRKFISTNIS